jgi:hypothetical protein
VSNAIRVASAFVASLACVYGLALFAAARQELAPVSRASLCVTEGEVGEASGGRLAVNSSKMRAYFDAFTAPVAEMDFTYLGSTGNEARLGSGELRRQLGLKLRAADACNLVYVMWRIEPESKLVVSIKSNPGQHTSAECANRGYRNIKPARSKPVPPLVPGAQHTLRAEMNGGSLTVFADGVNVLDGDLGADALAFDGPIGMRSDNAKLELRLLAEPPDANATKSRGTPGCKADAGEP